MSVQKFYLIFISEIYLISVHYSTRMTPKKIWSCLKRSKIFLRVKNCTIRLNLKTLTCTTMIVGTLGLMIVIILYRPNIFVTKSLHHNIHNKPTEQILKATPFSNIHLNDVYKDGEHNTQKDEESFELLYDESPADMIHTAGCSIPVAMLPYDKYLITNNNTCGTRAVFLGRSKGNNVKVTMSTRMKELVYAKKTYCCYRFFRPGIIMEAKVRYTKCNIINDGSEIQLLADFIQIKCYSKTSLNKFEIYYDDYYAFTKKVEMKSSSRCNDKYNVLMLGIDSMSLPRFVMTMKRTVNYFKENFWLSFRGNHKVAEGRFPNIISTLTGEKISNIMERCYKKMHYCNELMIWNHFKPLGYITAYGEDFLKLPNTFSGDYRFSSLPTHHYLNPLFLRENSNKSLICTGQVSSAKQVLDYAFDFALTYRKENFFGLFWMNSFSHNPNSSPQDADKMLEDFFNRLSYTGILKNTFLILFSNHGIRFGQLKENVESYYDERMPFLFILSPELFKSRHSNKYHALAVNQFRLVTHYDLYNTLSHIKYIATCKDTKKSNNTIYISSRGCPKCQSLFNKVSPQRTCDDLNIENNICGCHKVYPLDIKDPEGLKGITVAVYKIKSITQSIPIKKCWNCSQLILLNVVRIHFFYDTLNSGLHFLMSFTMTSSSTAKRNVTFEAIVRKIEGEMHVNGQVNVITAYDDWGKCVKDPKDRYFCVCEKVNTACQ